MTLKHRTEAEAVHAAINATRAARLHTWWAYLILLDRELDRYLDGWVVR